MIGFLWQCAASEVQTADHLHVTLNSKLLDWTHLSYILQTCDILDDVIEDLRAYLSQEAVHKHLFHLTEAVHPVYALYVIWRIPWGIKDNDPVGRHKVDAERASSCWDEKQSPTKIKENVMRLKKRNCETFCFNLTLVSST